MSALATGRLERVLPLGVLALGGLVGLAIAWQPLVAGLLVAAGLVAAVGTSRPHWLVAVMFGSILFDRAGVTGLDVSEFPVTLSKLSVLGSIGLYGLHVALSRSPPVRWHPVLTAMGVFASSTAVTLAIAGSMKHGKFALFGIVMMMVLVGLAYTTLAERPLQPLYRFMGVALVLALGAGLVLGTNASAGESARATGTFGDPNEWATLVLLVAPLVLGGLMDDAGPFPRLLRMALIALVPLGIFQAGSRTALVVGGLVGIGVIWLFRQRLGEVLACVGAAVVAVPFFVDLDLALGRFQSLLDNLQGKAVVQDASLNERSELLHQGLALLQDNWLVGVGPGMFARATGFISIDGRYRPAHNTYLEVACEQGLVGMLAGGFLLLVVGLTLWRGVRDAKDPPSRRRVLGAALGFGAFALMAATLGLLTFSMAYLLLGFTLAVVHQARPAGD